MALFWWHGGKIRSRGLVSSSIGIRKEISKDNGKKRKGMGDVRGALSRGTPGASITGNKSSTSAVPAATQIHAQCWAATCTGETHAGKTLFSPGEKEAAFTHPVLLQQTHGSTQALCFGALWKQSLTKQQHRRCKQHTSLQPSP